VGNWWKSSNKSGLLAERGSTPARVLVAQIWATEATDNPLSIRKSLPRRELGGTDRMDVGTLWKLGEEPTWQPLPRLDGTLHAARGIVGNSHAVSPLRSTSFGALLCTPDAQKQANSLPLRAFVVTGKPSGATPTASRRLGWLPGTELRRVKERSVHARRHFFSQKKACIA